MMIRSEISDDQSLSSSPKEVIVFELGFGHFDQACNHQSVRDKGFANKLSLVKSLGYNGVWYAECACGL